MQETFGAITRYAGGNSTGSVGIVLTHLGRLVQPIRPVLVSRLDYAEGIDPKEADPEMLGDQKRIPDRLRELCSVNLASSGFEVIFCRSGWAVALAPAVTKGHVLRCADVFLISDVESGTPAVKSDVYDSCWEESRRGGDAGLLQRSAYRVVCPAPTEPWLDYLLYKSRTSVSRSLGASPVASQ